MTGFNFAYLSTGAPNQVSTEQAILSRCLLIGNGSIIPTVRGRLWR